VRLVLLENWQATDILRLEDPSLPDESEFSKFVVAGLRAAFPTYQCVPFTGRFMRDDEIRRPDLALVARDHSHWFIVEVELLSHSLVGHVLPQIRTFAFGKPAPDCATLLAKAVGIDEGRGHTLIDYVPRAVIVVANGRPLEWEHALTGIGAHLLGISVLSSDKHVGIQIEGDFEVASRNLGFGQYDATDRTLRFAAGTEIPEGEVQLITPDGVATTWTARRTSDAIWLARERGGLLVAGGTLVQLVKGHDGRLLLRVPLP
jgi:hypothetical protein